MMGVQNELRRRSCRQSGGQNGQRPEPVTALLNVSVLLAYAPSALQSTSNKRASCSKALQLQLYVICFAAFNLTPSDYA